MLESEKIVELLEELSNIVVKHTQFVEMREWAEAKDPDDERFQRYDEDLVEMEDRVGTLRERILREVDKELEKITELREW
jgi:hypothetical protein